jgi:hypothetical protein
MQGRHTASLLLRPKGPKLKAVLWTVLTVLLVIVCFLFVLGAKSFPGKKTYGEAENTSFRLWSGLWKRDDADRR